MTRIAIIAGSTRPNRRGRLVADWVVNIANDHPPVARGEAEVELIDLVDFDLPLLDEPLPAMFGRYTKAHTQRWSETIAAFDGFVFVTPEYNQSAPAALKNALDFLFHEWANKPAGFVGYGVQGGVRAVEQLRHATSVLSMGRIETGVALSLHTDFEITDPEHTGTLTPAAHHAAAAHQLLDELIARSHELRAVRLAAASEPRSA
jgi:NAD(P)H-dependent FMN reductase